MNIGIDTRAANWYRGTGLGTYTYQLISSLNSIDGCNSYSLVGDSTNIDFNLKSNFNIKNIAMPASKSFWDCVRSPIVLSENEFEIYHVPQNGVGLPIGCCSIPFVITLHDTIPLHMPETVSDGYMKIFSDLMDTIVNRSAGIITVSNYSKQDIIKDFNYPADKIYVTHLASEKIYRPLDKSLCRNILKNNYSIENDFILYVGGFSPRKNIAGLIKAYAVIKDKLPDGTKLVIAGFKGKSYSIYKKLVADMNLSDSVIFPGFIDVMHMPMLYSGASLLVYPSFYEGFGLPPIEAMACGTPVTASNVTSIPEVLGDSALLFNPSDLDEMSECILKVFFDDKLRESLIEKGYKKSSSLTWRDTATKTIEAYNSIIK